VKKTEMLKYVMAAEGMDDKLKAAASIGISLMPKVEFDHFSALADRGLDLLNKKDYPALLSLLDEVDAPPDIIATAKVLIASLANADSHSV